MADPLHLIPIPHRMPSLIFQEWRSETKKKKKPKEDAQSFTLSTENRELNGAFQITKLDIHFGFISLINYLEIVISHMDHLYPRRGFLRQSS